MKTYLFVWNPAKWNWTTLEQDIEQLANIGKVTEKWSCASHKSIKPGDRAFLAKVGTNPKGIFAAGFVTSTPFLSRHWSGEDRDIFRVLIEFDVLLNPEKEPILTLDILKTGNLSSQNWTPQSSGISIRTECIDELEALWFDFLTTQKIRYNPFVSTESDNQITYNEGTPNQVTFTRYERNPYARNICTNHYGFSCVICGFNFQKKYGKLGKDFIHVHHLTQIAKVAKQHSLDPIKDLRPVCANCHAIIHRRKTAHTMKR
jgi:5-methylcytosine-specific restriction protein A